MFEFKTGRLIRGLDRPVPWKYRLPFILLIPLAFLLQWIASKMPSVVEAAFTQMLYPIMLRISDFLTGWFPFSLAEFLFLIFIILFYWFLIRAIIHLFLKRRSIRNLLYHCTVNILAIIGLAYFLFILAYGLNYQRKPLAERLYLDTSSPTVSELKLLCEHLISKANTLRENVQENDQGVMQLESSRWESLKRASRGLHQASQHYTFLANHSFGRPKGIILSRIASHIGLSGIYAIYTFEPSINMDLPQHTFPFTTCHEMAHRIGFAAEDEANFISYLACQMHPHIDYQYSGTVQAMRYALRALNRADHESFVELQSLVSEGIIRDRKAERAFWSKYRTRASKISRRLNDAYLKSQGKKEGIASYGKMVDLLIAEQRAQKSDRQKEPLIDDTMPKPDIVVLEKTGSSMTAK